MPVNLMSRYRALPVHQAIDARGTARSTVAIRRAEPLPPGVTLIQHALTAAEDVEALAWRYYGTSEAWWRIADANPLVFPLDWQPGAMVAIPALDDVGRVERSRRV